MGRPELGTGARVYMEVVSRAEAKNFKGVKNYSRKMDSTMIIEFTVYGEPMALKRHRTYTKTTYGRPLKIPLQVDPSKGDKSDFLALAMQYKPDKPLQCPIFLTMRCFFPRPKGHYNKKGLKSDAAIWVTKRPDWDNLGKFVSDALNGIFWHDDSLICRCVVTKEYTESAPRVEIRIQTGEDEPF